MYYCIRYFEHARADEKCAELSRGGALLAMSPDLLAADLGRTRGQATLSLERLHKLRKHTGGGPSCRARGGGKRGGRRVA